MNRIYNRMFSIIIVLLTLGITSCDSVKDDGCDLVPPTPNPTPTPDVENLFMKVNTNVIGDYDCTDLSLYAFDAVTGDKVYSKNLDIIGGSSTVFEIPKIANQYTFFIIGNLSTAEGRYVEALSKVANLGDFESLRQVKMDLALFNVSDSDTKLMYGMVSKVNTPSEDVGLTSSTPWSIDADLTLGLAKLDVTLVQDPTKPLANNVERVAVRNISKLVVAPTNAKFVNSSSELTSLLLEGEKLNRMLDMSNPTLGTVSFYIPEMLLKDPSSINPTIEVTANGEVYQVNLKSEDSDLRLFLSSDGLDENYYLREISLNSILRGVTYARTITVNENLVVPPVPVEEKVYMKLNVNYLGNYSCDNLDLLVFDSATGEKLMAKKFKLQGVETPVFELPKIDDEYTFFMIGNLESAGAVYGDLLERLDNLDGFDRLRQVEVNISRFNFLAHDGAKVMYSTHFDVKPGDNVGTTDTTPWIFNSDLSLGLAKVIIDLKQDSKHPFSGEIQQIAIRNIPEHLAIPTNASYLEVNRKTTSLVLEGENLSKLLDPTAAEIGSASFYIPEMLIDPTTTFKPTVEVKVNGYVHKAQIRSTNDILNAFLSLPGLHKDYYRAQGLNVNSIFRGMKYHYIFNINNAAGDIDISLDVYPWNSESATTPGFPVEDFDPEDVTGDPIPIRP